MTSIVNSTIWSATQRFGSLVISFVSNIVLARLLCPDDFGAIAMIMVFVGLADVLVDGGLGNALIQKKELSQDDIKTVFLTNLTVSVFLFLLFFFSANLIGNYVGIKNFGIYLRVESIIILIRAFYVVNFSLINRELKFKQLAIINLSASFIATVVAITSAICGLGIWSLIIRNIVLDVISCIGYLITVKVPHRLGFSKESFTVLFGYGFFIAISNILESIYSNLLSFLLGKKYSVEQLGYYNQAHSLEQIPVYSSTMVLNQVLFPYLSISQDNHESIRYTIKRSSMFVSFLIYPMMIFLICFAKPIIVFLYSDKWLPAAPIFQILCIGGFTNFLHHSNRSILKSIGKSTLLFYTQALSTFTGLILIFIGLRFSINILLFFVMGNSILTLIIIGFIAGKRIDYPIGAQLKDVLPNAIIAIMAGSVTMLVTRFFMAPLFVFILIAGFIFGGLYLGIHILFNSDSFKLAKNLAFSSFLKRR